MARLNPIETKIVATLLKRRRYATTAMIAKSAKISWNTAESYLTEFESRGWVDKKDLGRRSYWKAIRRR